MKKGFTFIELMIVLAIIVILAIFAMPMYKSYIENPRNASSQTNAASLALLQKLAQAQEAIHKDLGEFVDENHEDFSRLVSFGFRPDPNTAFFIAITDNDGFAAFAGNVEPGSAVYVYDNIRTPDVVVLDDDYAKSYGASSLPPDNTLRTYSYNQADNALTPEQACIVIPPTETGEYGKRTDAPCIAINAGQ